MSKTTFFAAAAAATLVATTLAACSGTSAAAPIAEADLPLQGAHALCDGIQPCCAQVGYTYDAAACLANVKAELQKELADSAGNGGTYDPNAAGDCVARLRAQAAACADPPKGTHTSDCGPIYVGVKKVGETCSHTAECAASTEGSVSCVTTTVIDGPAGTGTSSSGLCVLYKNSAVKGDPCGGSSASGKPVSIEANCEESTSPLYCDYTAHTCQDRIAIGKSCEGSGCALGAFCKVGVCAPRLQEGEACSYTDCATGLYCDQSSPSNTGTGVCAKQKKTGEACSSSGSNSCAAGRCSMGKCSAGSLATAGACKGEETSSSNNPPATTDAGTGNPDAG